MSAYKHTLRQTSSGRCSCCGLIIGRPPKHHKRILKLERHDTLICEDCISSTLTLFEETDTSERLQRNAKSNWAISCTSCKAPRKEVKGMLPLSTTCRVCNECLHAGQKLLQSNL